MAQKGVVFTTSLSTKECADLFREGWQSTRRVTARVTEVLDKVTGQGLADFYTPTWDSPFAAIDGVPDFSVGVQVLGGIGGVRAGGTPIHMYVFDRPDEREVQLVSTYTITGGTGAARVVRRFFEQFRTADPELSVTDGNV
jgi:hypothetical protein